MKSRIVSRSSWCSRGEVEVHGREPTTGRQRIAATGASLSGACPSPRRDGREPDAAPPPAPERPRRRAARPALRRDLLLRLRHGRSELAGPARRRGSGRAGPASSSSSARSRPPHLVSRQTVQHGVGRPRHLYDVTPDAQDLFPADYDGLASAACWRRSRRSAATTSSSRSSRPGGASSATGSATSWPSGSRADAPLADRVRDLAVIQDSAGLPRRQRRRSPTARSGCASTTARSTTSPGARRRPARRSWSCSARCSAPTSSARRTSRRATAAAPTAIAGLPAD